jgi:SHS family lactate transporter-like MFS transporter
LPDTFGKLSAGAFFVQFGVQGAWGVVPIYLAESSPASFRASFGGIAYQLGNMISAASAQIEAKAGETLRVNVHGKDLPDYASVQGILIGVVLVLLCKSKGTQNKKPSRSSNLTPFATYSACGSHRS